MTIPGEPISQPRQRHGVVNGRVRNWTPSKHPVNDYKAAIRLAWQATGERLIDGPALVKIVAVFSRPQSMLWKRRAMPRAPHTKRPDCENVGKAVLDALTGVAYRDDSQVVHLEIAKVIASGDESPHTLLTVCSLNEGISE